MSTILKALRRLEQEKSARADRPLAEAVASAAPPPAPAPPRRWPLVAGVAVAVAAVVGGGVFAFTQWRVAAPTEPLATAVATPEVAPIPAPVPVAPARPDPAATAAAKRRLAQQKIAARGKAAQPKPARDNPRGLPEYALTSDFAVVDRGKAKSRLQDPDAPLIAAKATPDAAARGRGNPPAGDPSPGSSAASDGIGGRTPVEAAAQQVAAVPGGNPGGAPAPPEKPRRDSAGRNAIADAEAAEAKAAASRPEEAPPIDLTQIVALQAPAEGSVTKASEPPAPKPSAEAAKRPASKRSVETANPPPPTPASKPAAVEVAVVKAESPPKRPAVDSPPRPATPDRIVETVQRRSSKLPTPAVYVVKTIWHPVASRRLAIVEIEATGEQVELREGEAVETLVVEKIEPSGVLFDHRGIEVRRRVGAR